MFVLNSLLILFVATFPSSVCTAGIDKTRNRIKNNSKINAAILPIILSIRLIEIMGLNL